jgi:DNA-binding helix-turn-helix protein
MYDFPELLKNIRKETGLTQSGLASKLEVSTILIAMIESGQKEPSKKFVETLAAKMEVSPRAIIPFVYSINKYSDDSAFEKRLSQFGMNLQKQLISKKAKNILK